MSDDLSPIQEAILAGTEEGVAQPEEPETPDVETEEAETPEVDPAWAQFVERNPQLAKFNGFDALGKSYGELEGKMRAGEHKQPEPEDAPPEPGTLEWVTAQIPEEKLQRVAYAFNENPVQAAVDLARDPSYLGAQATNAILREFARDDPWLAAQAQIALNQPQQKPQEGLSDVEQYIAEQRTGQVANWARAELPKFEDYEQRIAETLTGEHSAYYGQFIDPKNPDSYANVVQSIYNNLVAEDQIALYRAQAQQPDQPQPVPAAKRTATKSTAGRPTQTTAEQIQEAIANARG